MTTAHLCLDRRDCIEYGGGDLASFFPQGLRGNMVVHHAELVTYQCLMRKWLECNVREHQNLRRDGLL
jgi:hypothetical protein